MATEITPESDADILTGINKNGTQNSSSENKGVRAGSMPEEKFNERNVPDKNAEDSKEELEDDNAEVSKKEPEEGLKQQLENELEERKTEAEKLSKTVKSKNQELRNKDNDIKELEKDLSSKNKKLEKDLSSKNKELDSKNQDIASLKEKLNKPGSLWGWLATHFPNFFKDGEAEIRRLGKEIEKAQQEATHEKNQHTRKEQKWSQDEQTLVSEKKYLEKQIEELQKKNNEQLGQIASLKEKPSESIGDYEKHENYQIVTDYKAFCTGQALQTFTENICSQQKQKVQSDAEYVLSTAQIKATLSKTILVKAYNVQLRHLINKQPQVEFNVFFKSNCEHLLSQLKLPEQTEKLVEQLEKTAKKGFDIICQLVSTNPPCQLFLAEEGDTFNSEEYEVATGCPKEGIIKFTVVPGVISGYQRLMKPIVFTEK